MKIKTVFNESAAAFDAEVNQALDEGWRLIRRFSDQPDGFIAELVQLDTEPTPEAQPLDPIVCLEALRKFCAGSKCDTCPLEDWCPAYLPRNEGPADWELPGEEAGL